MYRDQMKLYELLAIGCQFVQTTVKPAKT